MNGFREFDRRVTVPGALARRAACNPDSVYLEEIGRGQLTFAQFHEEVLRWAGALRRAGIRAGERVAVLLPPSREAAMAWLGLAWIRALEVPVNTDYRGEILAHVLADSGARMLITCARFLDRLPRLCPRLPDLHTVVVTDDPADAPCPGKQVVAGEEFLEAAEPPGAMEPPEPWETMGIMYTGGTTGPSKGVVLPWGSQTMAAETLAHLGPDDAFYAPFPMFHGTGKVPLAAMAFAGGRDVIRKRFDTGSFWHDVDTHRCTATTLMPAMARWLLNQPPRADDRRHALREAIMMTDIEAFTTRFGIKAHSLYGQTESGNPICRYDVTDRFHSCGRERPGFRVRLVDEHDYDVPPGEVGELLVRCEEPWVTSLGYHGKPGQTVEAWRNGWIHTGDAMRRDEDGYFYFVDRVRDYIRRRGENISSFEVEALVAAHPGVAEVAAIAVPSEHGEDEVKVVVVKKPGHEFDAGELIGFLIPSMPRFMVPRYVEFVSTLPRTVASKQVRKVELRSDALNANTWDREAAGVEVPR